VIVLSNVVFLGLIEDKRWAHWMEVARGPAVAAAVVCLASEWFSGWVLAGMGIGTLVVMWGSWNVWRARSRAAATQIE
jgi:hypothetical protein